jgi:hypothetical protein
MQIKYTEIWIKSSASIYWQIILWFIQQAELFMRWDVHITYKRILSLHFCFQNVQIQLEFPRSYRRFGVCILHFILRKRFYNVVISFCQKFIHNIYAYICTPWFVSNPLYIHTLWEINFSQICYCKGHLGAQQSRETPQTLPVGYNHFTLHTCIFLTFFV